MSGQGVALHTDPKNNKRPREGPLSLVGLRGFEPPTPCSRSRCATRLRYSPTVARELYLVGLICKRVFHTESPYRGFL